MRAIRLYVADAFTAVPFRGNPASVCILDREISDATMRAIASEMNHSETAFVRPLDGPPNQSTRFGLRWFTPTVEVPLCGHATLAASAVIFRELGNPADEVVFETLSGPLPVRREAKRIALDLPAADLAPASASQALLDVLGVDRPVASFHARRGRNLLLHVSDERQVRALSPDFEQLHRARGHAGFVGVIVTAAGLAGYDFISRYFAPWIGVNEDPVTGAAHCALAPYWASLSGKQEMRAHQASPRGGDLTVRVRGDRVVLVGDAVVVMSGELRMPTS